jgi:lipoprotein-releasing system permease protein
MGLDNRVVISSVIAKQFEVGVGDKIKLYSTRNLESVQSIYDITNQPLTRERYAESLKELRTLLANAGKKQDDGILISEEEGKALYNPVYYILKPEEPSTSPVRKQEAEILNRYLGVLDKCTKNDQGYLMPAGFRQEALGILNELEHTDRDKMDLAALRGMSEIVLPKEAEVVGVYQASQMTAMPDIFLPLPLAQELCGLQDSVQGIAIRLNDPYAIAAAYEALRGNLPPGWSARSWVEDFGEFSRLIQQQRVMMYFALSFIILVSAFSMMAVMFTVTIQKRREIGVMKALGAAARQIIGVFVYQGMILGMAGSILGVAMGLAVIHWRGQLQAVLRQFDFDPFPADFNGFNILPADIRPVEITLIAITAFILCTIAAFVPAFFAARSDAAKSLRNL